MLKKLFFLTALSFCFSSAAFAQYEGTSLGARFGTGVGLSMKSVNRNGMAVEGMLLYRREGIRTIALIEKYISLGRRSNSAIYFGIGGHAGYDGFLHSESYNNPSAGVDAILGFEYFFDRHGVVFSLDVKPAVEALQGWRLSGNDGGVSLRFLID